MGINERKQREREVFISKVLETSHTMIQESGFEEFSIRKLANSLEYSVSKLYQVFDSKEAIIYFLYEEICKKLYSKLKDVPHFKNKEKYLCSLAQAHTNFFLEDSTSSQLVHYVCFNTNSKVPKAYQEAMQFYTNSIKDLNYKTLKSEQEIEDAFNSLRLLLSGIVPLTNSVPKSQPFQLEKVVESAINTLIKGWYHPEIENSVLK